MKKAFLLLGISVLVMPAQAATRQVESNGTAVLFEASGGAGISQFGLGLGIQPEDARSGFGGLYFESTTLDDRQTLSGRSLGNHETTIKTLGIRGFSVQGNDDEPIGADVTFGLSQTKTEGYDRTGMSARAAFYFPVMEKTTWYAGLDVRPKLLSFDWSADVLMELGFDAGVDVRVLPNLGLYAYYYYENMLTDDFDSWFLGSGVAAGLSWVW